MRRRRYVPRRTRRSSERVVNVGSASQAESEARLSGAIASAVGQKCYTGRDLTRLYALHGARILSHCYRLLGDRPSAEDATQDVFLRIGRYLGRRPPPEQIRPWLFRIATNRCLNELRSRSIRARHATAYLAQAASDQEEAMAARSDARRFLEQLSSRAQAVAVLTYVDGMIQREVATSLGISRRTVVNCLSGLRAAPAPTRSARSAALEPRGGP